MIATGANLFFVVHLLGMGHAEADYTAGGAVQLHNSSVRILPPCKLVMVY